MGIISARMHLYYAIARHREVFANGIQNVSMSDCQHVNREIGIAIKKLHKAGVNGKCNEERAKAASAIVKQLFLQHPPNKSKRGRRR